MIENSTFNPLPISFKQFLNTIYVPREPEHCASNARIRKGALSVKKKSWSVQRDALSEKPCRRKALYGDPVLHAVPTQMTISLHRTSLRPKIVC